MLTFYLSSFPGNLLIPSGEHEITATWAPLKNLLQHIFDAVDLLIAITSRKGNMTFLNNL